MRSGVADAAASALLILVQAASVAAERLPVTVFTVADGLADDTVTALLEGRDGVLWIGTPSGLSRFDGREFRSYGAAERLPSSWVADLVEDRDGTLWLIAGDHVVRMRDRPGPDGRLFDECPIVGDRPQPNVFDLVEDRGGDLWLTADASLFRYSKENDRFERVELAIPWPPDEDRYLVGLAAGSDGSLWIRASFGLVRRRPDGRTLMYPVVRTAVEHNNGVLTVDADGRVWLSGDNVLAFLPDEWSTVSSGHPLTPQAPGSDSWSASGWPRTPGAVAAFATGSLVSADRIHAVLPSSDGALWVAGDTLLHGADGPPVALGGRHGLPGHAAICLLEDRFGSLWIGSEAGGLVRLDRGGMSSWTAEDGLATVKVGSLIPDHLGGVLAGSFPTCGPVHRLEGDRFQAFRLPIPRTIESCGWGESQVTLVDHLGDWWVPTTEGLLRFGPVGALEDLPNAPLRAWYTVADGLGDDRVFRLFEDAGGNLWIGVFGMDVRLVRWERRNGRFHHLGAADGLPVDTPSAFAEAADGTVWVGFYGSALGGGGGGVASFRDGRFRYLAPGAGGPPPGFVSSMLVDAAGRLWATVLGAGVARLDDPLREDASWTILGPAQGLSSSFATSLAEDALGRIYVGTNRGLDQLDPATGRIRHWSSDAGLANNSVVAIAVDGAGDLWIATSGGVSRLRPDVDEVALPPCARVFEVRVAGRDVRLPETGLERCDGLALSPTERHVEVAFAAVDLRPGRRLRYQYRLGDGAWSEPSDQRRVHLAGLAAGAYRFEARAVLTDGAAGPAAVLGFTVAAPLWRRWWFQAGVVLVVLALGVAVHRRRVGRLAELHRVRSRIAADLHDELGLSLSRVALLAEVARPGLEPGGATDDALVEIAASARDLVDATSDMAWALDPAKDDLPSLLARLRRLGGDVCESAGVAWSFTAPDDCGEVVLKDERRRHLYLILKEGLHNAIRHGQPSRLALAVRLVDGRLLAEITDDGRGFDPDELAASDGAGHGLTGMRRRAEELGGALAVESRPGTGTTVRVEVPLHAA